MPTKPWQGMYPVLQRVEYLRLRYDIEPQSPLAQQVLEQALGQSVVASAESGQLWVSCATQPAGAPLSEVWRAAAVLDVLPQHLAWLADLLMVRLGFLNVATGRPLDRNNGHVLWRRALTP